MPKIDTEIDVHEELERYDQMMESIWEDMGEQGLSMPTRPNGMPEWPEDVTGLGNMELFQLHGEFEEFLRYITGQASLSKATLTMCKEKTALVRAAVRKRTKGTNKEERDDSTTLDGLYQKVRQEEIYWHTLHGLHAAIREIFDDDVKAISRQLNRAETDNQNSSRRANIGHRTGRGRRKGS